MSDDEVYVELEPARCEDCGIRLDRHGGECGMEIDDPRAEAYFPPGGWVRPISEATTDDLASVADQEHGERIARREHGPMDTWGDR